MAQSINPIPDFDGSFTAVRLGTLGIAFNSRFVKEAPKTWADLQKPVFKGAYGIANPALSGTSYMSVALLSQAFGWEYFEKLRANKAKMGKGSGQVIDDTASGDLLASLAVDYITIDKIEKGATLKLVYPEEMLADPEPDHDLQGHSECRRRQGFRRLRPLQGKGRQSSPMKALCRCAPTWRCRPSSVCRRSPMR